MVFAQSNFPFPFSFEIFLLLFTIFVLVSQTPNWLHLYFFQLWLQGR
jgi:hypothetical protein